MKKDAEYYVKVYCDYLMIEHYNDGVAFEGPHTLGKMLDFLGDIPAGSGYYFDTISAKVSRLFSTTEQLQLAKVLLKCLTQKQFEVVCQWEILIGKHPEKACKVLLKGTDVAAYLGVDYKSFNECRNRAIDRMNAELGRLTA